MYILAIYIFQELNFYRFNQIIKCKKKMVKIWNDLDKYKNT